MELPLNAEQRKELKARIDAAIRDKLGRTLGARTGRKPGRYNTKKATK